MTQTWGVVNVPLEHLENFDYWQLVVDMMSDQIVGKLTGCKIGNEIDAYVANTVIVPRYYIEHGMEDAYRKEIKNEVMTFSNYNESLPKFQHAMEVLAYHQGQDFNIAYTSERNITVLVEGKP